MSVAKMILSGEWKSIYTVILWLNNSGYWTDILTVYFLCYVLDAGNSMSSPFLFLQGKISKNCGKDEQCIPELSVLAERVEP